MFISFSENPTSTAYKPAFKGRPTGCCVSKEKLIEYIETGYSCKQIAETYNYTQNWICNLIKKYGLEPPSRVKVNRTKKQVSDCLKEGMNVADIADKLNETRDNIYNIIEKFNLKSPTKIKCEKNKGMLEDITLCINQGVCDTELAKKFKMTKNQLLQYKKIYGLTMQHLGQDVYWEIVTPHLQKNVNLNKIAKKLGITQATVGNWIQKNLGTSVKDLKKIRLLEILKQEKTNKEIAQELNLNPMSIKAIRRKYSIDYLEKIKNTRLQFINSIGNEHKNGSSIEEIAKKHNITPRGVEYTLTLADSKTSYI